jgi:DNA adenine methylase
VYAALVSLLQDVEQGRLTAKGCLTEVIRQLVLMREAQRESIERLLASAQTRTGELSAQQITEIVGEHLRQPRSSRLPVLVVAAVYEVIAEMTGKTLRELSPHTAADMRTGALGDIEIVLPAQSHPYTVYEVKARSLRRSDIDTALQKLAQSSVPVAQYVFVVTNPVAEEIHSYLKDVNNKHVGTEFQIFDCIQMLDHFLHLFHERRREFLDKYTSLVVQDTAVNQKLKEKLLELVRMAEKPIGESATYNNRGAGA